MAEIALVLKQKLNWITFILKIKIFFIILFSGVLSINAQNPKLVSCPQNISNPYTNILTATTISNAVRYKFNFYDNAGILEGHCYSKSGSNKTILAWVTYSTSNGNQFGGYSNFILYGKTYVCKVQAEFANGTLSSEGNPCDVVTPQINVTFNPNGGSGSATTSSYSYGDALANNSFTNGVSNCTTRPWNCSSYRN